MDSQKIYQHYTDQQDDMNPRSQSRISSLRGFNNWVKMLIIQRYTSGYKPFSCNVLDLCCGKGGDLGKFSKARIGNLTCVDVIPTNAIKKRYDEMKGYRPMAKFISKDCFVETLSPPVIPYDYVNCQFAIHYAFETESKARRLFENAVSNLSSGGHFAFTTIDATKLLLSLKSNPNGFGNSIFKVKPDKSMTNDKFGSKYYFTLDGSIDDCPEYLVRPDIVVGLASEYGLKLVWYERFHDFYYRHSRYPASMTLFENMKVFNEQGVIEPDQWEAIGYYCIFGFEKV
jgi:mRNA (guanine-N7-)-methyltransferase